MIGYIKGKVLSFSDGVVLLENNGIGYEISCSASVFDKLVSKKEGEVYTYLAVREDGVSLYGFISPEEKAMFLKLISVSGVGPKLGITILSGIHADELACKIATSDVKGLSSIKGLGKKTAERIILELREKVGKGDVEFVSGGLKSESIVQDSGDEDAIIALMSLGFTKQECLKAIKTAKESGAKTVEQLISYSIRNMG